MVSSPNAQITIRIRPVEILFLTKNLFLLFQRHMPVFYDYMFIFYIHKFRISF